MFRKTNQGQKLILKCQKQQHQHLIICGTFETTSITKKYYFYSLTRWIEVQLNITNTLVYKGALQFK